MPKTQRNQHHGAYSVLHSDQILLFSIKPKYSKLIFKGKKKVELRKRAPKQISEYAFVYESAPTQSVVGLIKIKSVQVSPIKKLWSLTKERSAVEKKFFKQYYKGHKTGVAIEVTKRIQFDNPISLERLRKTIKFTPPQDYCYIQNGHIKQIIEDGIVGITSGVDEKR